MARGNPYRLVTDEHMKQAHVAAAARRDTSMGTIRSELKKLGYSDRDLRLQGILSVEQGRVLKPGKQIPANEPAS